MRKLSVCLIAGLLTGAAFSLQTYRSLLPLPASPEQVVGRVQRQLIVDRSGQRLINTYENQWNLYDQERLDEMPPLLLQAFVTSEDRQFYSHHGVDWPGRFVALSELFRSASLPRGASTITEQVVRMLHPRPRTFWSRWLETWEAYGLEKKWSKISILEFYLNQVPYTHQRRGVVQAARFYFGRDLKTLNSAETLGLAVLVRAPSAFDPQAHSQRLVQRVQWLAAAMGLSADEESIARARAQGFERNDYPDFRVEAPHFSEFVRKTYPAWAKAHGIKNQNRIHTTLNGNLQNFSQSLLDHEIASLKGKNVNHGALLAVDHQSGEILAWAVSGGTNYNTVLVPRQPGSSLKPFLYALSLERGWTPATLIVDEPLVTAVGRGVHAIRNYSRQYYGPVTLREALGNSLNTPAIKTVKFVTPESFLDLLHRARFSTLNQPVDFYGEGLALGSAEVPLFELVQAYTLFMNEGRVRRLHWFTEDPSSLGEQVVNPLVANLIANILSDPKSRLLEFGHYSILNFPQPTAVKTGTATDYRDAWAVGFNGRYTVGVWMGDLDRKPTEGNTGARGPAMVLRSVFNYLSQQMPPTPPLTVSDQLVPRVVCRLQGQVVLQFAHCDSYTEYFVPGTENFLARVSPSVSPAAAKISFPVPHMDIAWDPRIPAKAQAVQFRVENIPAAHKIIWRVDGKRLANAEGEKVLWPLRRGAHRVTARIYSDRAHYQDLEEIPFQVK
jgi:penicillin-binding protein 1C